MNTKKTVDTWKNPIKRSKTSHYTMLPIDDCFKEISEENIKELSGANTEGTDAIFFTIGDRWPCNISRNLGNPGAVCTLTVECQNNC